MEKFFKKMWLLPVCICTMLSCLALTACSDDDDNNSNDEPETTESEKSEEEFSIIGSWQCIEDTDEGFTFYKDGKVLEKDKGNYEMTYYKFSQEEGKLWIYMFGEEDVTIYPLENTGNWDEYSISIISKDSFKLSYELYFGEIITETFRRIE